jgi:hypothetical protein
MYTPADAKILKALAALENDKDFIVVVEWFEEMEKELQRTWPKCKDDIESRWVQGRMQVVTSVLELVKNARDKYERHEAVRTKNMNKREVLRDGAHS